MSSEQPLVSVITPVYNGEAYLAECIRSVLDQTYHNWEYHIVNNRSSDSSLKIAQRFASQDSRVHVHDSSEFRLVNANFNYTVSRASAHSKYCKPLMADDWLYPECIEKMVKVAEENPSVGLVASYLLRGNTVAGAGLAPTESVVCGRDVCRRTFNGEYYLFGSPTTTLMRSELIRKRSKLYNESNPHADVEACFDLLQESDFGFVHQILTVTRLHENTITSQVTDRLGTNLVENKLGILTRFGPKCFSQNEFESVFRRLECRYYRELARHLLNRRERAFWEYQTMSLEKIGLKLNKRKLVVAVAQKLLDAVLNPKRTVERFFEHA